MSAQTDLGRFALEELSQAEKEVYRACELQGIRPAELTKHSDREASTIRTLLHRARKKVDA